MSKELVVVELLVVVEANQAVELQNIISAQLKDRNLKNLREIIEMRKICVKDYVISANSPSNRNLRKRLDPQYVEQL